MIDVASPTQPQDAWAARTQIEQALDRCLSEGAGSQVTAAARYAVLGGGHRWRSLLAIASGRIFRPAAQASRIVMPLACSLELIHAASLVLDDLPSMDAAMVRRNRPCVHVVFPQWVTDMLPAYLVNLAYKTLLANELADPDRRVRVAVLLGRVGQSLAWGQELDVTGDPGDEASAGNAVECCRLKTGELFAAATAAGGILCGADEREAELLERAGLRFGLAYQFLDDVADAAPGEPAHPRRGEDANKVTAVSMFGRSGARAKAGEFIAEAMELLAGFGRPAEPLRTLFAGAASVMATAAIA